MERRRPLASRARLATVALLVLVAATACGDRSPIGRSDAVATVNGHEITLDEVQDLVDAQRKYLDVAERSGEKTRAQAEAAGGTDPQTGQAIPSRSEYAASIQEQRVRYTGTGVGTIGTAGAAEAITTLVGDEIDRQALRAAGGEVTAANRTKAKTDVEAQIKAAGVARKDVPDVLFDEAVAAAAVKGALGDTAPAKVTDVPVVSDDDYTAQLRKIYEDQLADYTQLCVNIILTPKQADAAAARQRVEAGEDFADVAEDVSTEGRAAAEDAAGGCVATADVAGVLGDDARGAKPGDLIGPGAGSDGSFVLVQVVRVQVPTFEELQPQLAQANPNTQTADAAAAAVQQYVADLGAKAIAKAEVTVEPRYGTWDAGSGAVVPPEVPGTTTTSTTAAPSATVDPASAPAGTAPATAGS